MLKVFLLVFLIPSFSFSKSGDFVLETVPVQETVEEDSDSPEMDDWGFLIQQARTLASQITWREEWVPRQGQDDKHGDFQDLMFEIEEQLLEAVDTEDFFEMLRSYNGIIDVMRENIEEGQHL